jgi:pimeloyl-ACP methyl ester carboxylesterase
MATRYAHNGPVRIAHEDHGGAGGDPLLLVMGLAMSRFWWPVGFVDELLDRGFHVVSFDNRDAGESTRLPDHERRHPITTLFRRRSAAYTGQDQADDAVAVLDALGWPSAHLLGISLGGVIAQRVGLRHPTRVRSITTISAGPADAGPVQQLRHVRFGAVLRMGRLRFPEGRAGDVAAGVAVARAMAGPGVPFDEEAVRATAERDADHGIRGVRDSGAQSRQTGARWSGPGPGELRVPVLVVHGDADPLVRPSAGRATAAAIEDARFLGLPGVGHDLPRPVWPRVADEVRALADRARGTDRG